MEDKVILRCSCGSEFIEVERVVYAEDPTETIIYLYHLNTSIKWSLWQKLLATWDIFTKGRALLYDIVLTDTELKKLQTWIKTKKL